jgi:hypothetical protein
LTWSLFLWAGTRTTGQERVTGWPVLQQGELLCDSPAHMMSALPLAARTAMFGPDASVILHHVVQLVLSKSNFVALALAGMDPN